MADIPRAVLSEYFQDVMKGRVLRSGVFLTFRFEPGFFEQEVLPVFLDLPLSHEPPVRLVQLEDAVRERVDHLAVYYDQGALEAGSESAKLDVKRVPVLWATGFFHPKNVLLLVEDAEADENGIREQRLLVASLSANLTRAGWWENVEVCHVEELRLDHKTSLRGDLLKLISRVKAASPLDEKHAALEAVRRFVLRLEERKQLTADGVLHSRLYVGSAAESDERASVPDFLDSLIRSDLKLNLEVISPYFDDTAGALRELVERFEPVETRVYLPLGPDGKALCPASFYETVRKLPNARWGKLPSELLRSGTSESAAPRRVHAKVYRFFRTNPKYEALFVGSVNLTTAAHSKGGNFETGFVVERELLRAPDWWLSVETTKPSEFLAMAEDEGLSQGPGAALVIRYSWDAGSAHAFWSRREASPALSVESGVPLFRLDELPPQQWIRLSDDQAAGLAHVLRSTSLLTVKVEGYEPAIILVQEEGMAQKPSILLNLTVADILRCWASLTPEQKAILLEERYQELAGPVSALSPKAPLGRLQGASIFDAFAGIFHAFSSLERNVMKALAAGREKEAVYLLFGKKYDSLPRLLDRVLDEEKQLDAVNRYVILLCARQLLDRARSVETFRLEHRDEFRDVDARLARTAALREAFTFGETAEERGAFLDWFEAWFLKPAEPARSSLS
jgi:hypothetical protein